MNILFIATFIPYPPSYGGSYQRTFNIIKHLAKENNIFLIGFVKKKNMPEDIDALKKICSKVVALYTSDDWSVLSLAKHLFLNLFSPLPYTVQKYYSRKVKRVIEGILKETKIDILHLDAPDLAGYMEDYPELPSVLVNHNVESILMKGYARQTRNIPKKLYFYLQGIKMRLYEKRMLPEADACIAVSDDDGERLKAIAPKANISIVPNGVDTGYFCPKEGSVDENNMIFIGSMDYYPNLDATIFFCKKILPLIKKEVREAKMIVIGAPKPKQLLGIKDVEVLGFIEDVRPYIQRAGVYIAPLRIGSGTRLKILEALACGKAIVSTSIGCEGLAVTHYKDILIADRPEDFAKAVITLMKEKGLREKLGKEGRRLVEERYDWGGIVQVMKEVYKNVADDSTGRDRSGNEGGV